MKRKSLIALILALFVAVVSFCVCFAQASQTEQEAVPSEEPTEKPTDGSYVVFDSTAELWPAYDEEWILGNSELIIRGKILSEDYSAYSNPENDPDLLNQMGTQLENTYNTYYTVQVDEVYKGSVDGDRLTVVTVNYRDEDGRSYVEDSGFDLSVGEEAILCLCVNEYRTPLDGTAYYSCNQAWNGRFYRSHQANTEQDSENPSFVNRSGDVLVADETLISKIQQATEKYEKQ